MHQKCYKCLYVTSAQAFQKIVKELTLSNLNLYPNQARLVNPLSFNFFSSAFYISLNSLAIFTFFVTLVFFTLACYIQFVGRCFLLVSRYFLFVARYTFLLACQFFLLTLFFRCCLYFFRIASYSLVVNPQSLLVVHYFYSLLFVCCSLHFVCYNLCLVLISLISRKNDYALGPLHHDLFHNLIRTLEQGNACSKSLIRFEIFDLYVDFSRQISEIWTEGQGKGFSQQTFYVENSL